MTAVLTDTFAGRTVGSGWGTASDGHTWTTQQAGPTLSVGSSEGQATGTSANRALLTLDTPGITDGEILFRFSASSVAGEADVYALMRYTDVNNYYWFGYNWINATTFNLAIRKRVAGVNTTIVSSAITVVAGTFYWVRSRIQGSNVWCKFWQDGNAEPGAWTLTSTDSALTTGSLWGLAPFTVAAETVKVDTFTLDDLNIVGASAAVAASAALVASPANVSAGPAAVASGALVAASAQVLTGPAAVASGALVAASAQIRAAVAAIIGNADIAIVITPRPAVATSSDAASQGRAVLSDRAASSAPGDKPAQGSAALADS